MESLLLLRESLLHDPLKSSLGCNNGVFDQKFIFLCNSHFARAVDCVGFVENNEAVVQIVNPQSAPISSKDIAISSSWIPEQTHAAISHHKQEYVRSMYLMPGFLLQTAP